ncbi:hypothetical protein QA612_14385 [Evansella sp. AB-P1]|uniref:hypothetical protein n=1 Tax=Evansella sp. AB-P1 TaxID=3037653 RepID=UPI0024201E6F|nr:hypothetical protein [Evansella sp. AB-P1]MDG5788665.1 hypothetical protein [Evansella sp. AB-P1]
MKKMIFFFCSLVMIGNFFTSTILADDLDERCDENECEMNHEQVTHHHEMIKVHLQYYYELLIEKHSPELKEEWREIVRDREAIHKKIKEMKKEGKEIEDCEITKAWKEKHKRYQEMFLDAVNKRDSEKIESLLPLLLQLHKQWNENHLKMLKGE